MRETGIQTVRTCKSVPYKGWAKTTWQAHRGSGAWPQLKTTWRTKTQIQSDEIKAPYRIRGRPTTQERPQGINPTHITRIQEITNREEWMNPLQETLRLNQQEAVKQKLKKTNGKTTQLRKHRPKTWYDQHWKNPLEEHVHKESSNKYWKFPSEKEIINTKKEVA